MYSLSLIVALSLIYACHAWIIPSTTTCRQQCRTALFVKVPNTDDIVDVDFERVKESEDNDDGSSPAAAVSFGEQTKTLLDVSMESGDPQWKQARIPFCRGQEYIDGKLAFMVELEGMSYGIAVPFDDPVAIVMESPKKGDDITYVDPDNQVDDESQELMEIMAAQVKEHLGDEYDLRKTPKVLTVSGGLGKITDNWEQQLMPQPASVEELLKDADDDVDDEIAGFYQFMKEELGEKEFEKTMKEELSEEEREFMKFFDVPGVGTEKENLAGLEDLVNSMTEDVTEVPQAQEFQPDTDGVSLKLIGFNFADGSKSYSLVKLLQPYVLIGKYIDADEDQDIRFELLTPEEEQVVIPKLEELCREDLEAAGLSLPKEP